MNYESFLFIVNVNDFKVFESIDFFFFLIGIRDIIICKWEPESFLSDLGIYYNIVLLNIPQLMMSEIKLYQTLFIY